jgi:hypothetical protein
VKNFIEKTKKAVVSTIDSLRSEMDTGVRMVKSVVDGLPIFVSLERGQQDSINYDEKHYFVIPYHLSNSGFSLHTMRSLPNNVLEVNDLPKRRVFHFPNEHYEGTLRIYMINAARNMAYESSSLNISPLEKLADDIDSLDSKLTYGMLLVGGIAAIFNPLIGAGIAAKAVLPSLSGMLTKHGLKPLGEKATLAQIEKKAKEAEEHVLNQFSESTTLKVINPILNELEFALRTSEAEHDPLWDPNLANGSITELDSEDWRNLTELAICHVYKEVLKDKSLHEKARLGPEDLRWLEVLLAGKMH